MGLPNSAVLRLEWGHRLLTPEGQEIRVPKWAFPVLQRLGVLNRYSPKLKPRIYSLLNPEYHTLTDGLRFLLGADCSGPAWLVCNCGECRAKKQQQREQMDTVRLVNELKRKRRYR